MRTYRKGTGETISIGIDWSDAVGSDSIASSSWSIADGLTGSDSVYTNTTADIDVSAGTENTQYLCTSTVTTGDGYVYERSVLVMVVDR